MHNGVQDLAIFQQQRYRTGNTDDQRRADQFGGTFGKAVRDVIRFQSANITADNGQPDEHGAKFIQVPIPARNTDYQHEQGKYCGKHHAQASASHRWVISNFRRLRFWDIVNQAGGWIGLHALCITPYVMKRDRERGHENDQSVFPTRSRTQFGNVLCHQHRKRIKDCRAITHSVPRHHNADCRHGIQLQCNTKRNEYRHNRNVFFRHAQRRRCDSKRHHANEHEKPGTITD